MNGRITIPRIATAGALAAAVCLSCGCQSEPPPPVEYHYTRNETELYTGLEPDAPTAAVLDFDTQVVVLDTHRSFVNVRTSDQLAGWLPKSMLLDEAMRQELRSLSAATAALPSQGVSRARDTLNVHLQPYRWSTTFYQLKKDEGFEILDRMLVDRMPAAAATAQTPPEPTGEDYWYLVRVPRIGQAGWLIANMAYADLPLEVAMLAGGHTIVGYFAIGTVDDETLAETKTDWLWLQSTERGQTHDFDLLKVLRWDTRRNRYLIIRQNSNLKGYLPVEIMPGLEARRGGGLGFRILLERAGALRERTHLYMNRRVYQVDDEPVAGVPRYAPPGGFGPRYEFKPPP